MTLGPSDLPRLEKPGEGSATLGGPSTHPTIRDGMDEWMGACMHSLTMPCLPGLMHPCMHSLTPARWSVDH